MIERGGGRIINIASDAGLVGSGGQAVYAATKGGVIAFTKSLAGSGPSAESRRIVSRATDTPLWADDTSDRIKSMLLLIPLSESAEPGNRHGRHLPRLRPRRRYHRSGTQCQRRPHHGRLTPRRLLQPTKGLAPMSL